MRIATKNNVFFLLKIRIAFRFNRIIIDRIHKKWSAKKYIYTKNKKNKKIPTRSCLIADAPRKKLMFSISKGLTIRLLSRSTNNIKEEEEEKKSVGSLLILVNECLSV